MCLKYLDIPDEKEGIGYKVVRKINETTFRSYFPYFAKDGSGGLFSSKGYKIPSLPYKSQYTTKPQKYYIGKTHVVKHKRTATTRNCDKNYHAGIHLYKEFRHAKLECLETSLLTCVVIECKYEEATFCDDYTIVAMKITPLSIVE